MKRIFLLFLCLIGTGLAFAMDISPYKAGQILTTEQAEELNQRYANRSVQEWRAAPDKATIKSQAVRILFYTVYRCWTKQPRLSDQK
jgi:hypothetical protein